MEVSQVWITGGMNDIMHKELIARGAFGEVHKVHSLFRLSLTYINSCITPKPMKYKMVS